MITILAIESSCDETAASVCRDGQILSNIIFSQKIHEIYGGVVPELASRAHLLAITPVVEQALAKANVELKDIDAFAFTQAPGLIGALLVGAEFAKSLALAFDKPLIAVHHMQAHVLANLIQPKDDKKTIPEFPFLCLTVSGGHTQIVLCQSPLDQKVIGQTLDDAAGEARQQSQRGGDKENRFTGGVHGFLHMDDASNHRVGHRLVCPQLSRMKAAGTAITNR